MKPTTVQHINATSHSPETHSLAIEKHSMHPATPTPSRIRFAKAISIRHVLVLFLCYCLLLQPNAAFANSVGLTPSAPTPTNKALNDSASDSWSLLDHIYGFFEGNEAVTPVVAPIDAAVSRLVPTLSNGRI